MFETYLLLQNRLLKTLIYWITVQYEILIADRAISTGKQAFLEHLTSYYNVQALNIQQCTVFEWKIQLMKPLWVFYRLWFNFYTFKALYMSSFYGLLGFVISIARDFKIFETSRRIMPLHEILILCDAPPTSPFMQTVKFSVILMHVSHVPQSRIIIVPSENMKLTDVCLFFPFLHIAAW